MKKLFAGMGPITLVTVLCASVAFASKPPDEVNKAKILNKTYRMQVPFIENKGQVEDDNISFYAKTFGGTVFVGKDGTLIYSLPVEDKGGVVIKEVFTDKKVEVKGLEPSPTRINYFKGKDRNKWKTNIPSYNSVSLGEVYKGVELTLKAYGKNVEKLFKVLPGENPEAIAVALQGAKELKVNEKGELEVITEHGPVAFTKPIAYQEIEGKRIEVEVSYKIEESGVRSQESEYKGDINFIPQSAIRNQKWLSYGFSVEAYDKSSPLIIDPLLASTFLGGSGSHTGESIALDGSGNVYVTGLADPGFPTTPGSYDETHNGPFLYDVFVSKLDSDLSSLLASTFLGGDNLDSVSSLTLDGSGNVYVTGRTQSGAFPTTTSAYDESHNGASDVFVSKLDSDLSSLLASTFLGGGFGDWGEFLTLDGSGNVYVTGQVGDEFPITSGAYDESHNGGNFDVFVAKLNSNLSTLLASTFIGGSVDEVSRTISLDKIGNVYITGRAGDEFPTTSGAYDESHNGASDVFVSKLDSDLSSLLASTFLGGDSLETGFSLTLDGSGNVFVTGETDSPNYPTTVGAYDESDNGGPGGDVFVSKLDSNLSSLLASTFLGGSIDDYVEFLALDASGDVYVTGYTHSSDYPTTSGAYDESHNGNSDVFVSKFDSTLSTLLASTYIGGGTWEGSQSLFLDGSGNLYLTGYANDGFPTTTGAYDESYNGGSTDVIVSKLDRSLLADLGITFRSAVDTGGFAGSSQFLEEIPPLDDPFAIVQCQNYTVTIDFWLTDWQGVNVKAMDYYFTWDTSLFSVDPVSGVSCNNLKSSGGQWQTATQTLDAPGVYHLTLDEGTPTGVPDPDGNIKLHTVELSFATVPAEGLVKAELLPDGYIEDANSTEHHSIGKTEITLKTICDVGATTTCDADNPCDVLDSADICPAHDDPIQDNYSWEPVNPENPLCEGDLITIYHTKTGTRLVEEPCTENICTSECFNSCLTACREIEINECAVRAIGNCINGIPFPWDETDCINFSRITACNFDCFNDCSADCAEGNAFYNRSCGFHMGGEEITIRVPDGTGGCTGEVKRQRTLSGDGTAWMPMTLPMEDGPYDICSGAIFIGTVVVEPCGEPTCALSVPGGFTVNHGATGTLLVTLEDLDAGDTYLLSLEYWKDDAHTIPLTENFPDFLDIDLVAPQEITVGPDGTATFNVKATDAEPGLDEQTHWANITVRADPDSYSWDCECSFNLDVVSDEDEDGIPLEEDNCPDIPNGPAGGTCTRGTIGLPCMNDTTCGGEVNSCSMNQEDRYPPGGNDIGDACDCEADFTCDGDVDADDVTTFLAHFGREEYYRPCTSGDPCIGDFICDADVDADDVTLFLEDFGREEYYNPCPPCDGSAWCVY